MKLLALSGALVALSACMTAPTIAGTGSIAGPQAGTAEARENLKPYPEAETGQKRHVIYLEPRDDEGAWRVGLFVGRIQMTDGVNRVSLGGIIEQGTVQGWGYPFFDAELGQAMSTLIGVPPGTPQVEAFVHMPEELVRYNSRLPLVVYAPEDAQVRYRLYQAGGMMTAAGAE